MISMNHRESHWLFIEACAAGSGRQYERQDMMDAASDGITRVEGLTSFL